MSFFDLFNARMWIFFFALYTIFLSRYFLSNNIPIQFDSNIIILIVFFPILIILFALCLYLFSGMIERGFRLKYKLEDEKEDKLFKSFDILMPYLIPFLAFIEIFKILAKSEIEKNIEYVMNIMIFIPIYIVVLIISYTVLYKRYKNKKFIYLNSIIVPLYIFYTMFDEFGAMEVFLLFLAFSTFILFLYIYENEEYITEKLKLDFNSSYLYSFLKEKTEKENNGVISVIIHFINKFNLFFLSLSVLILFSLWDSTFNEAKVNNFITNFILKTTKIGSYKTSLVIDKKLVNEFEEKAYNKNKETFTIDVNIIWENEKNIYIKYNSRSIKIAQENIFMNKYIIKRKNKKP